MFSSYLNVIHFSLFTESLLRYSRLNMSTQLLISDSPNFCTVQNPKILFLLCLYLPLHHPVILFFLPGIQHSLKTLTL